MSTSTGFALGVTSVAVAICIGFSGGYMLTKTDEGKKIPPSVAAGGSSSPVSEKAETNPALRPRSVEEPSEKPSLIKPAEASTVGMASAEIKHEPKSHAVPPPEQRKVKESVPEKAAAPARKRIVKKREPREERQPAKAPDLREIEQAIDTDIRQRQTNRVSANSFP
jgi:hypothetical protein